MTAAQNQQALRQYTWLEEPDDKVTLDVQMASLPDGTSYGGQILLSVSGEPHRRRDHEQQRPEAYSATDLEPGESGLGNNSPV